MTTVSGKVLIVDDEKDTCEILAHLINREGLQAIVSYSGDAAVKMVQSESPDVLLVDFKMPGMDGMEVLQKVRALDEDLPVVLITGFANVRGAVDAIKAGAHDYLAKPFDNREVLRVVLRALAERSLKRKLKHLASQVQGGGSLREIMGPSDVIGRLISNVNRVAKSNFSVVVLGETGSGKEVVAQAIHKASSRSEAPFIPIDCGAIPETLLESELFGHEKGAFTGADSQKPGKLEAAREGTLFLDEISNMPLGSQAKLLRALQEKTIYRVGSTKPITVDVRILAASNYDLQNLAVSGSFRLDLFFRLNEFTITVPPLRERKEDILYLAKRFLDITSVELNKSIKGFSESAIEALLAHNWPGNVRQLRSTIRRAVLLADEVITEEYLDVKRMPSMIPSTDKS
ncbi:MAG: sigma-54 dependent transcriptional regulator, partial [Nitrospira sp.]|nr:sigma-54 dependent transcriptional regulator [Nitrospira sp.]